MKEGNSPTYWTLSQKENYSVLQKKIKAAIKAHPSDKFAVEYTEVFAKTAELER